MNTAMPFLLVVVLAITLQAFLADSMGFFPAVAVSACFLIWSVDPIESFFRRILPQREK